VLNVIQTIPSVALFGLLIAPLAGVARYILRHLLQAGHHPAHQRQQRIQCQGNQGRRHAGPGAWRRP
jgi:ABC-type proline/glycine betaine transport system permease subunit